MVLPLNLPPISALSLSFSFAFEKITSFKQSATSLLCDALKQISLHSHLVIKGICLALGNKKHNRNPLPRYADISSSYQYRSTASTKLESPLFSLKLPCYLCRSPWCLSCNTGNAAAKTRAPSRS